MVKAWAAYGDRRIPVQVMLDSGSNRDIVIERVASELDLARRTIDMTVTTLGSRVRSDREIVDFDLFTYDGVHRVQVKNAIVGEIWPSCDDRLPRQSDIVDMPHLEGVEFGEEVSGVPSIGIILSVAHSWTWCGYEVRRGPLEFPIGLETLWGWTLIGPAYGVYRDEFSCHLIAVDDHELDRKIDRLFRRDFEELGDDRTHRSINDEYAYKQMSDGVYFDEHVGHYRVPLPFLNGREDAAANMNSRDSSAMAARRLDKLRARLMRDPVQKAYVFKKMREYHEKGHAVKIAPEDAALPDGCPRWTLPILVVPEPKKMRWRICHDARATVDGMCLNHFLLPGPENVNSLRGVGLRFRLGPVAFSADIEGYFHQVYVDDKDAGVFRYWWFADEKMEERELSGFLGNVFGAASSTGVSAFTLLYHGRSLRGRYSDEIIEAIEKQFYVDDLLDSAATVEAAREKRIGLTAALAEGGFPLVKWRSTHPEVLEDGPLEDDEMCFDSGDDLPMEKILGMAYSFGLDAFSFRVDMEKVLKVVRTRRELLSFTASMYDPFGFVAPFVLLGKLKFQEAMRETKGWDALMSISLAQKVSEWIAMVPELSALRIPRWLSTEATVGSAVQWHIFCDASLIGYGYVIYRRVTDLIGGAHVAYITGNSRVVPLRANHDDCVPRLELTAAVLAAEVAHDLRKEAGEVIGRRYFWTDSHCVLKLLNVRDKRLKTFFHNRVSRLHKLTDNEEWNYCPSELNTADACSRGLRPSDPKWMTYLNGPDFLREPEAAWPEQKVCMKSIPAAILAISDEASSFPVAVALPVVHWCLRITDRLESWSDKVRRIALFRKAMIALLLTPWKTRRGKITLSRRRGQWQAGSCIDEPSMVDLRRAETVLVAAIQQEHYAREIGELKTLAVDSHEARKGLRFKSSLLSLNPFVDADGILRCGGRLANALALPYESRFPAIMPQRDSRVDGLIRKMHMQEGHAGIDHVLCQMRRRFWVVKGRQSVRRVVLGCVPCQIRAKAPMEQKMAALPDFRLEICAPFENCGVDCCGPFQVRITGRAKWKVWVVLFTCLTMRAVHLEYVRDMSTSSFINALKRCKSRRPGLRRLYSDCGSNFLGAHRELRRSFAQWNAESPPELRLLEVSWSFNPPLAAHRGGVWERLIAFVKRHLAMMLERDLLPVDVFATVLVEVEAIVNRRPLTHVSSDCRDVDALTPADLLYPGVHLRSYVDVVPPEPPGGDSLRLSWKRSRSLSDEFWRKWSRHYLSTLHSRAKWRKTQRDLAIGDVVLLVDEQLRRHDWRLARVESVKGSGDHVRSAFVRTAAGKSFERDRTKLVLLELDGGEGGEV